MLKSPIAAAVFLVLASALCAGERIVHLDEMDNLATRTALFNEGALVRDARKGAMMLLFRTDERHDFHKRYFPIDRSPTATSWSLTFRFRFDRPETRREFGLKLYFGDRAKPETRLLTVREAGSHFEGSPVPPMPSEGAPGFLCGLGEAGYGAWNSAGLTVHGRAATFWVMRGGRLVAEATGELPEGPLVGWNLTAMGRQTNFGFDRLMVVDGVERPYERGDLQEILAERSCAKCPAWDPAFGAELPKKQPYAVDLSAHALEIQFRAPFRRVRSKGEKGVACAFEFHASDRREKLGFSAADQTGKYDLCMVTNGAFARVTRSVTASNALLRVSGLKEAYCALPPVGHWRAYEAEEISELLAAQNLFPKPSDHVYTLRISPAQTNAYDLTLDGQVVKTLVMPSPITAVSFSGDDGAEARVRLVPESAPTGPRTWKLPVPEGGFKLERVRENLGTFMFECNGYLSRDAFQGMPSSCLFNVPRRQWSRARARVRIDPTAPPEQVPVIVARLTHFNGNGGRSEAICQETVDLSKPDARVRRLGEEYEVTFDFDVASIMDLTSMTDGLSRVELPYLHVEFTGPVWDKSSYYLDARRSPAEDVRSNLIVLSAEIEESPVWFRVRPERSYSLYYPGETPKARVEVRPLGGKDYRLVWEAGPSDGTEADVTRGVCEVGKGLDTLLEFPVGDFGHYQVRYRVIDAQGCVLQRYVSSYGLLPPNTRKANADSPYYAWNFRGAHGTPQKLADWAPAYAYLGIKRTLLDVGLKGKLHETNAIVAAHGFRQAQFPWIEIRGNSPSDLDAAKAKMRRYVEAFPSCKTALIFHECSDGPFPREIYGEKTELDAGQLASDRRLAEEAEREIKCWLEVEPKMKLIIGNSGRSVGLVARLMRGGLDPKLVYAWGDESVGLTELPEMTTALWPWCFRKIAAHYGYPGRADCPWEWKGHAARYERSTRFAAAKLFRDQLIAFALGYTTIPVAAGTETANSYADTVWCSSTFSRWPLAFPRETALQAATETLVLDQVTAVRPLRTGSLVAYALEFELKSGKRAYVFWTARGETSLKPVCANGAPLRGERVDMVGRKTAYAGGSLAVSDEPAYLVTDGRIASFAVDGPWTFRHEHRDRLSDNRTVASITGAGCVTLDFSEDVRIDPKLAIAPFRPGRFAAHDASDPEKGACLELEHLSQAACPEIMREYVHLRLKDPLPIERPFDTLGVWVKGNANWGRVSFELVDAEGETWYTSGVAGTWYTYDWQAMLAFNYEGWNFLAAPVTARSEIKDWGYGAHHRMWTSDASGNRKLDYPVKVTALGVAMYGRTLNLLEMEKSSPVIRIGNIEVR